MLNPRYFTEVHGLGMAGRCGEWIQAGSCLRLMTREELDARPVEPLALALTGCELGILAWTMKRARRGGSP